MPAAASLASLMSDAVGAMLVLFDMVVAVLLLRRRAGVLVARRLTGEAADSRRRRCAASNDGDENGEALSSCALPRQCERIADEPLDGGDGDVEVLQRLLLAQPRLRDARLRIQHLEQA